LSIFAKNIALERMNTLIEKLSWINIYFLYLKNINKSRQIK
jgi:hypothetical protein